MSRLKERLIAYALVFCTLATAIGSVVTLPVRAEEAIGEGTIGLTGYTIEIKNSAGSWEPLTDSHTVRNGDELRIAFNWELANGDTSADLVADITPLAGILLGDSSHRALPDVNNGNQIIGEYWVENNKLHIRLTDENYIQHTGERKGGATITGTVKVEDAKDGQKVTVQIGSTSVSPNFTTGEPVSGASVQKWAMGSLEAVDGGAYRQKYGLKIETWWNSGEIREISVDDILGEGLENMSEFTVESSGSGLFQAGESYTLEEINQILRGQSMGSLSGQESVTFSYTADVKAGYESGALEITPGDAYKNTATLRYTNNKDEEKTESSSAVVAGSQPSIDKGDGILSGDGKTITWTITIYLNGTKWEDITSITDIPGAGLEKADTEQTLDKSLFTEMPPGSGIYTYTYTTTITDACLNSTGQSQISNKVQMQTRNGGEFSDTGYYTLQGKDWITKKFTELTRDGEGNALLNWQVTLDIPADAKNIVLTDWVDESAGMGKHELYGDLYLSVDGSRRLAVSGVSRENYHGLSGKVEDEERVLRVDWEGLHLQDSLAGKTVEIYYTTKVTDSSLSGHRFINYAQVNYQDAVGKKTSLEVPAEWESKSALSKAGVPVEGANAIRYTLKLDLTKLDLPDESGLGPGDKIVLMDKLPDGLTLDKTAEIRLKAMYVEGGWESEFHSWDMPADMTALPGPSVDYALQDEERTIVFTIPVTEDILKLAKLPEKFPNRVPCLFVEYTLKVSDEAAFVREEKFVNQASGTFRGSSIGEAQTVTILTPQPVVSKTAKYDDTTAPYAEYTVDVNPRAIKFFGGDWLEGKDILGSALSYDLTSIKVVEVQEGGNEKELTAGTDYKYAYSLKENSLTFKLPDGKHLKITYRAMVSGGNNGKLNEENSGNTFSISGHSADVLESSSQIGTAVIKPSAWAVGDTVNIQIFKYQDENGFMEPLSGAKFHIVEVMESGGGFVEKEGSFWDAVTGSAGTVNVPGEDPVKLVRGQVYKLTETEAPAGYVKSEEAIYFVIPDESTDTEAMEAKGVKAYAAAATIYFQNSPSGPAPKPADTGQLTIQKTVSGGISWDKVKEDISFVVSYKGAEESAFREYRTIPGTALTAGGSGVYQYTLEELAEGEYQVKEIASGKLTDNGKEYVLETVTYQIDGRSGGAVTELKTVSDIPLEKDGSAVVRFINAYKRDTGSLTLTKTVSGLSAAELEAAIRSGKIKFVLENVETKEKYSHTLAEFLQRDGKYVWEISGLPTGTYTITESDYDMADYQNGITYSVTGKGSGTGAEASVAVTGSAAAQVEFTDTYTSTRGSLVIRKQVSGKDLNDHMIGWELVKDTLSFVITDEAGTAVRTVSPSVDAFTDDDGDGIYSYTVTGLDAGKTYIVTETAGKPEGYAECVVTYSMLCATGSGGGSGSAVSVQISSSRGAVVTFTNTYEKERQPNGSMPSPPAPAPQPSASPQPSPVPKAAPVIQLQVSPLPSSEPQKENGDVLSADRARAPQTGDYFSLWVTLFCLSLGSLMGYLGLLNRKKRGSGEQAH